ncbi:MAG: hypothetical protein H6Q66_1464 [Firmicutes bacterium]|nr:hypothetical protein [Bacillota bacterium]
MEAGFIWTAFRQNANETNLFMASDKIAYGASTLSIVLGIALLSQLFTA